LWGASLALHEGSEFVKGRVKDTNLDTYTPLRMGDVPEMDIEFLPSTEVPTGLGEPRYHRGRPGDRKRHICRGPCAPAPFADPAGRSSAGSQDNVGLGQRRRADLRGGISNDTIA
jgi:hypothetical protein